MNTLRFKFLIVLLISSSYCFAQTGHMTVKEGGILIPSVATHQTVSSPENGQLVYNTTTASFWYFHGSQWTELGKDDLGNHTATQHVNMGFKRINYLANPVASNDGATKIYVDAHQDTDADPQNEIQEMSVSVTGDTMYLEGAGHIIVPGISDANYIKDGDGNVYQEIEILGQTWLEPSLQATKFNDGTPIENPADIAAFWVAGGADTPAYMWYDQDSVTHRTYGALYNWYTVDAASNGGKNICPVGYRVPTEAEGYQLRDTLSPTNTSIVGQHLKTVGWTYWLPGSTNALDTYGFAGKGAGRIGASEFEFLKRALNFWTTTAHSNLDWAAYSIYLNDFIDTLNVTTSNISMGHSIRCIKDE